MLNVVLAINGRKIQRLNITNLQETNDKGEHKYSVQRVFGASIHYGPKAEVYHNRDHGVEELVTKAYEALRVETDAEYVRKAQR